MCVFYVMPPVDAFGQNSTENMPLIPLRLYLRQLQSGQKRPTSSKYFGHGPNPAAVSSFLGQIEWRFWPGPALAIT